MPCRRRGKKDQEEDDERRLVQRAESKIQARRGGGQRGREREREREDGWNAPIAIEFVSVNRARMIITRARIMTKL